jgi:hypothetical protein
MESIGYSEKQHPGQNVLGVVFEVRSTAEQLERLEPWRGTVPVCTAVDHGGGGGGHTWGGSGNGHTWGGRGWCVLWEVRDGTGLDGWGLEHLTATGLHHLHLLAAGCELERLSAAGLSSTPATERLSVGTGEGEGDHSETEDAELLHVNSFEYAGSTSRFPVIVGFCFTHSASRRERV